MKSKFRYIITAVVAILALTVGGTKTFAQSMEYGFYPQQDAPKVRMEWGVGAGASYTGMAKLSPGDVQLKPRFGIGGHIDMAVCIGRNFAIETEINYEGGSIDAATPKDSHKVKTRTIDIPLLLSLRMAYNHLRISAGPLFTVMSHAEYTDNGETMFFGPVSPTWNMAAGIGVGIGRHFIIEARYVHPLKSNVNQFEGVELTTRSYRVTAGVTVLF